MNLWQRPRRFHLDNLYALSRLLFPPTASIPTVISTPIQKNPKATLGCRAGKGGLHTGTRCVAKVGGGTMSRQQITACRSSLLSTRPESPADRPESILAQRCTPCGHPADGPRTHPGARRGIPQGSPGTPLRHPGYPRGQGTHRGHPEDTPSQSVTPQGHPDDVQGHPKDTPGTSRVHSRDIPRTPRGYPWDTPATPGGHPGPPGYTQGTHRRHLLDLPGTPGGHPVGTPGTTKVHPRYISGDFGYPSSKVRGHSQQPRLDGNIMQIQ